jgi:hypothetical protein
MHVKDAHFDCSWTDADDASLLRGVYKYGTGNWEAIRMDPELHLTQVFNISLLVVALFLFGLILIYAQNPVSKWALLMTSVAISVVCVHIVAPRKGILSLFFCECDQDLTLLDIHVCLT